MNVEGSRQFLFKLINKEKWWDILSRLIDVLHINIFIVDNNGSIILPPEDGKYGGRLLTDDSLGFNCQQNVSGFLDKFKPCSNLYLEYISPLKLYQFAIPLYTHNNNGQPIGYLIVGPIILNKRPENSEYEIIARNHNIPIEKITNEINDLRVVSNVMMNSILDLLYEIVKNNIELSGIKLAIDERAKDKDKFPFPTAIKNTAKNLFSTVCVDELLVTFLDAALKMTDMECGSILAVDPENRSDMTIKVSKGLPKDKADNIRIKIGEGICGFVALEQKPIIIHGQQGDNRIKHLLKRPEIQHSLIMPLKRKRNILGVLNLHTCQNQCNIENNIENLQYLCNLLSSVI